MKGNQRGTRRYTVTAVSLRISMPLPGLFRSAHVQGLTLVHFSAQLEPILTQKHTLNTPSYCLRPPTQPLSAPPIPQKALMLSRKVDECKPLPT